MNDEQIKSLGQAITRQHAVAEQLAARVMQMEEVNAELLEALKSAKTGLEWYQDAHPESASECDNEAMQEIDAAIARAESAIETPAKGSPCAGHAVQQEADEQPRNILLEVAGKSFCCSCGCNVFQKLDPDNENEYTCNACHATYEAGGA